MKYFLYLIFLISSLSCSQRLPKFSQIDNENNFKIIYKIPKDTLSINLNRKSLVIRYKGTIEEDCNIAFRVFKSMEDENVDLSVKSSNYIGTFSLGVTCDEKFKLNIGSILNKEEDFYTMQFIVIPIDFNGGYINRNLRSNFTFSIE